jgi:hypothetical protein
MKRSERQKRAKSRLEAQLKSGVKNTSNGKIPLNSGDIVRIEREISSLSNKIK